MTDTTDPSYFKARDVEEWKASRRDAPEDIAEAKKMLLMIRDGADVFKTIRKNPLPGRGNISKYTLVLAYHQMVESGELAEDPDLLAKIRMKPLSMRRMRYGYPLLRRRWCWWLCLCR